MWSLLTKPARTRKNWSKTLKQMFQRFTVVELRDNPTSNCVYRYRIKLNTFLKNLNTDYSQHYFGKCRHSARHLRSSGTPLLSPPSTRTDFAVRGFRHSTPAVWNPLSKTVVDRSSLTVFKSRLKTHLFELFQVAYNDEHWLTWPELLCTASEVTTLWRYRNVCIIIIIIII